MISLPRSPLLKLMIAVIVVLSITGYILSYKPSIDKNYWAYKQQQEAEKDYRSRQQHQQEQYQQEQQHPQFPAEGTRERVPLSTFKVPESLHLTHDVAIPHAIPPWTKADTDMLDTSLGYSLMTEILRQEYSKNEDLTNHPERLNFAELSRAERIYKALWNHVYPIYQSLSGSDRERERQLIDSASTKPEVEFFLRLEKHLYPWLHYGRRTSFSLHGTFKGRGLVFCAGDNQFEFVVTAIQAIRNRLKSKLPIQVYHMGEEDLSKPRQKYLTEMAEGIEVVDVTAILDNSHMKLGGWAIKPFAMLASNFEEVMFVDADAYFLQDPAVLFDDPGYMATGALFFYDRTLFPDWTQGSDWLKSILPIMSSFPPISRMFNLLSAHEQESGVVLINKKTRFLGLLGTCKMNGKWERDLISYKIFHGDKETFWTGFEMVQEPYAFMRNYGGVIGELRPDDNQSVCGAQLHEDHKGQPLWWNGGLYRNKNEGINRYLKFDYWMTGGGHQKHRERYTRDKETMIQVLLEEAVQNSDQLELEPMDASWDFKESCLVGAKVNELTKREKTLANGYIGIDRVARKDGQTFYKGGTVDPRTHDWTDAIVTPPARWGHVSVLCGNQLYIHGGHTGVNPLTAPVGSDLYSLDISAAFNSFTVPWAQLTPGPYAAFHIAGLLGPSNNLLALFGGNTSFSSSPSNSNSLHLYDTLTGSWTASPLQDPSRREQAAAASRLGDGTMYVMGGMILTPDLTKESATSELWSIGGYITPPTNSTAENNSTSPGTATQPPGLSPQTVGWQKLANPNSLPSGLDRSYHTATMIRSNGLIVIIGGVSGGALVPMSEIAVYDTATGTWSVQTATGATPPLRRNHVAVATSAGQIYVHGGTDLGATTFFADLAILDTTSWSWSQPAIGGNAPTGRYSHAATMVGSNILMTFGLTAGGSNNNIFILDTATNAWVTSYTPNALAQTSTKPEDWPGYKPLPVLPSPSPGTDKPRPPPGKDEGSGANIGAIVGGLAGAVALAALLFIAVRRRRLQLKRQNQYKATALYASDYSYARNSHLEEAYRPTGMAFEPVPQSFGQRMEQVLGGIAFWRRDGKGRRAANASYSRRLSDREEDEGMGGLQTVTYPTDQEIFLDAVHRARSRAGHLSPLFTPLQQPLSQSPPGSPRSPRFSSTGLGHAGPGVSGAHLGEVHVPNMGQEVPHGRAYSDGFENAMLEMEIQMVAVPRGRLYVVNPSEEALEQEDDTHQAQTSSQDCNAVQDEEDPYRQFDSQAQKQ
ncbi:hypothetical protein FBU30_004672 [Linnemannia zychae]|nr:hypothetical protein FBU30_004672 [Linnemannia zychae]